MNNSFVLEKSQSLYLTNQIIKCTQNYKTQALIDPHATTFEKSPLRTQPQCKINAQYPLVFVPHEIKDYDAIQRRTWQKWEFMRDALSKNKVTDHDIRKGLKLIRKSIRIFQKKYPDGSVSEFTSNTKGTARYAKRYTWKLHDWMKHYVDKGYQTMFFTITCDPKLYESQLEAWQKYYEEELKPVLEHERKHNNLKYAAILESTKKGYPHAHIMLCYPPHYWTEYDKMKNNTRIKWGKIYNALNRNKKSRVTCLKVVKGENVAWYMTKYLTKSNEAEIEKMIDNPKHYTDAERKTAIELLTLKAIQKRGIFMTKIKEDKKDNTEEEYTKERYIKKIERQIEKGDLRAKRAILNMLCTNSPFSCANGAHCMSLEQYQKTFNHMPEQKCTRGNLHEQSFKAASQNFGCAGCFWSEFYKLVVDPYSSKLNKKFYWDKEKDIYTYWSDSYDWNNDKEFFEFIGKVIDYYMEGTQIRGKSISQLALEDTGDIYKGLPDGEYRLHGAYKKLLKNIAEKPNPKIKDRWMYQQRWKMDENSIIPF